MGIIIHDNTTDNFGYSTSGNYVSFSRDITFEKTKVMISNPLNADDASGNINAYSKVEYILDASGNPVLDASGNPAGYVTNYYENVLVERYHIEANLVQFKDKDSRVNQMSPLKAYTVVINIPLDDFPKMFELLYNHIKSDKNIFPYNDFSDDM